MFAYTLFIQTVAQRMATEACAHAYFASTCAAGNHVTVGNQVRLTKVMAHRLIQV